MRTANHQISQALNEVVKQEMRTMAIYRRCTKISIVLRQRSKIARGGASTCCSRTKCKSSEYWVVHVAVISHCMILKLESAIRAPYRTIACAPGIRTHWTKVWLRISNVQVRSPVVSCTFRWSVWKRHYRYARF